MTVETSRRRIPPVAGCYKDDQPLVFTFLWSKFEYFCLTCGTHYTYFGPKEMESTPELEQKIKDNEKIFEKLTEGWIADGAMRNDCGVCRTAYLPHISHASEAELLNHEQAQRRFAEYMGSAG